MARASPWLLLLALVLAPALAESDPATVSCPATAADELFHVTRVVLTTSCPAACTTASLCVYFPLTEISECGASTRACLRGATCGFECIPTPTPYVMGVFMSLFTNATSREEIARWGAALPRFALNASQVTGWVGDVDKSRVLTDLYISGNEEAKNMSYSLEGYADEDHYVPRGEVVPFELPSSFFANHQNLISIRLENVKYPSPPQEATTNFTFPVLQSLFLRNTMLTEMPLPLAKFKLLFQADLSANRIRNVTLWGLPATGMKLFNLSTNEISFIAKGAFPSQLVTLDLSQNPLKEVPNGTLPNTLKNLYLDDTILTQVPDDVARMAQLTKLYLHNNKVGSISENVLPSASLKTLGVNNCSLQEIPSAVGSLTKLTTLQISDNDLSGGADFSLLPATIERIEMRNCKLRGLGDEMRRFAKLSALDFDDNPRAVSNLSMLPESIEILLLNKNGLKSIPQGVQNIRQLKTLSLLGNSLIDMTAGSLPSSLRDISFSDFSPVTVKSGTLPQSITRLSMVNCNLEEAPRDIASMQSLFAVNISGCQLRSFVFTETLPVAQLDLANNRLTQLSVSMPVLVHLNVSGNSLTEFTLTQAPLLETLLLADNNLTSVPSSLVNFPKLSRLDIARNPIRNFKPSVEQLDFLSKLPVVIFDQDMFATDCEIPEPIDLRGYRACGPRLAGSKRKLSVAVIIANVCVSLGLALLIAFLWRRRRLQKQKQRDLESQSASLEKQRLNQSGASIWTDPLLLRHRLDENLVLPISLLGSGMFGEVWLASYMGEEVALKTLKHPERDSVEMFIDEIKLVLTLSHARIVSSVGVVWTKESDIALVTEFMAGGDLRSYLEHTVKAEAGWTAQMVQLALEITEGVVYLHSFDPAIIHRDLKSRNVLLDLDMQAKLTDFGVSRIMLDETMTAGVGTVRWIAPEVLAGQRYDESADIYSLGVIMCEIDTHQLPFANLMDEIGTGPLNDSAIAGLLISGSLQCEMSDACPRDIQSLAERCMAFDPRVRPSGLQVAHSLRRFLRSLGEDR